MGRAAVRRLLVVAMVATALVLTGAATAQADTEWLTATPLWP